MGETRKFTILHSNDMHGDFLAEVKAGSGHLIGGLLLFALITFVLDRDSTTYSRHRQSI